MCSFPDLDALIEHLRSLNWKQRYPVQLIVCEQEDSRFRTIDIFPVGVVIGLAYENARLLSLWAISDALKDLQIKLLESSREASRD